MLQGVSSFDLDYISRDFWGNSIAVQVPKEKSRAAEEHFDHAKSILYKYSPFHVFFANGMHEMKKDGCTDIMNPENDEVICKDFNNNRLLNNERQPGTGNLSYDAVSVIQAASIWKDHGHENRCMLFMVIQHSGPKTDGTDVNDISRIRNMVESLSRVSTNNLLNQIDDFYYGTVRSGKVTIYDSYVQEIYSDDEKGMDTEDLTVYRDPKSLNTDKIRICIRESSAAKVFLFVPEEDARGYNYELSVNGNLYNISGLAIRKSTYIIDDISGDKPPESILGGGASYINLGVFTGNTYECRKEFHKRMEGRHFQPKEPAFLKDKTMSPYKIEQNIRLAQTIGRFRMHDPGPFPMEIIDSEIIDGVGAIDPLQFGIGNITGKNILNGYELKEVVKAAEKFREKKAIENGSSPIDIAARKWNETIQVSTMRNLVYLSRAKDDEIHGGMIFFKRNSWNDPMIMAIASMESSKAAVKNPFILERMNEEEAAAWIADSFPEVLDIDPDTVQEWSEMQFCSLDGRYSDSRYVIHMDTEYIMDRYFREFHFLSQLIKDAPAALKKEMPYWSEVLEKIDEAYKNGDSEIMWQGLYATVQGATALLGEFGEFAARLLLKHAVNNAHGAEKNLKVESLEELLKSDHRYQYEDCDIFLREDIMVDVKNYSEERTILSSDSREDEAYGAFVNKVLRFPSDMHVYYVYFMPFLVDMEGEDASGRKHIQRYTCENSRIVREFCSKYRRDFEIIIVNGVIPRTISFEGWQRTAESILSALINIFR